MKVDIGPTPRNLSLASVSFFSGSICLSPRTVPNCTINCEITEFSQTVDWVIFFCPTPFHFLLTSTRTIIFQHFDAALVEPAENRGVQIW